MTAVKVMRNTLEKPQSLRKPRETQLKTQRAGDSSKQFNAPTSVTSSTYVKVLDRMKGHLMKKPGAPSTQLTITQEM